MKLLISTLFLMLSFTAAGNSNAELVKAAASNAGVSTEIYYGLLMQESGRNGKPWKWTLNVSGKGMYFETRAEAENELMAQIAMGNKSIDVGLGQVNVRWNGHYVNDLRELLNPSTGLRVSSKILKDCRKRFETIREALSCYNAGKVSKVGLKYADKVIERSLRFVAKVSKANPAKSKNNNAEAFGVAVL